MQRKYRKAAYAARGALILRAGAENGVGAPAPAAATAAEVRPPKIPAKSFAGRNQLQSPRLSPDGKRLATQATLEGKPQVIVLDTDTRVLIRGLVLTEDFDFEWLRWAGNDRLLIGTSGISKIDGEEYRYTRAMVLDLKTGALTFVGKSGEGLIGDDVLYVDPAGEYVLIALQRTIYDYPSVWRFPLDGTAAKAGRQVQAPRTDVWDWYADNSGAVRMGVERLRDRVRFWYRKNPTDSLAMIGTVRRDGEETDGSVWDVERIVAGSDEGYALQKGENGRYALRRFNYATRQAGEVIYANPDWDVSEAFLDDDNKPIAAYFTDDRQRVVWFDPVMKSVQARLDKAMKGSEVWVISRAKDDSRMLVWTGHAGDPGALYLFNPGAKSMNQIGSYRPQLDPAQLAVPRPIAVPARDGVTIRGYLTVPKGRAPRNLPLIILPHGGPYGVRDTLEYSDEVQLLANRGYAVIQPNYRGSGGYGDTFEDLGNGQIGRGMQDDIDDTMDWAVKQGLADAKRVCVVGSSYGGYAAMWAVIRNPERYRCAASFAGVSDWKRQLAFNANFFTRKGNRSWRQKVRGEDTFDLDTVSPLKQAARLTRPLLLAHGDKDPTVPFSQFKAMRGALEGMKIPVESLVFKGEGHGFAKAENEQLWYETLERFLATHNPPD